MRALGIFAASPAGANAAAPPPSPNGQWEWPTYGRSAQHTFSAPTTLDRTTGRTRAAAWFFPTGDAVTANPIGVGSKVCVGSWDGFFYALDRATGQLRWKYQISRQPAVPPQPGEFPRDITSEGGLITSSASEPSDAARRIDANGGTAG